MVDKIKQYLYGAVGLIIAVLGGAVYFLLGKNDKLKSEVGELKAEDLVKKEEIDYENQKRMATDAEKDYDTLRNEYLLKHGSDGSTDE